MGKKNKKRKEQENESQVHKHQELDALDNLSKKRQKVEKLLNDNSAKIELANDSKVDLKKERKRLKKLRKKNGSVSMMNSSVEESKKTETVVLSIAETPSATKELDFNEFQSSTSVLERNGELSKKDRKRLNKLNSSASSSRLSTPISAVSQQLVEYETVNPSAKGSSRDKLNLASVPNQNQSKYMAKKGTLISIPSTESTNIPTYFAQKSKHIPFPNHSIDSNHSTHSTDGTRSFNNYKTKNRVQSSSFDANGNSPAKNSFRSPQQKASKTILSKTNSLSVVKKGVSAKSVKAHDLNASSTNLSPMIIELKQNTTENMIKKEKISEIAVSAFQSTKKADLKSCGTQTIHSNNQNNVQKNITNNKIKFDLISCGICMEVLSKPHLIECGHSFCYECLRSWSDGTRYNGTCPKCRHELRTRPVMDLGLEEIIDWLCKDDQEKLKRIEKGKESFRGLVDPWKGWLEPSNSEQAIHDIEDGVSRCNRCGWEIEDGVCDRCDIQYHDIPRDASEVSEIESSDISNYESDGGFVEPDEPLDVRSDSELEEGRGCRCRKNSRFCRRCYPKLNSSDESNQGSDGEGVVEDSSANMCDISDNSDMEHRSSKARINVIDDEADESSDVLNITAGSHSSSEEELEIKTRKRPVRQNLVHVSSDNDEIIFSHGADSSDEDISVDRKSGNNRIIYESDY